MKRTSFNFDWTRIDGEMKWFAPDMSKMQKVDLPDDFMLNHRRGPDVVGGASVGFIDGGIATYLKEFSYDKAWDGKRVLLMLDGAYMNAEITLNHDLLFRHPYGYTAFMVDLTDSLYKEYPNKLHIKTDTIQPNSRWYPGGGIFREVSIVTGDPVRILPWEVFVTTKSADEKQAELHVEANITNDLEARDADIEIALGGKTVLSDKVSLKAKGETKCAWDIKVRKPKLWSVEEPNLYALSVKVASGEYQDVYEDEIGIRVIEIDVDNGFRLNGVPMKLRGGCIHHDNTLLGSRAYYRAEERKIQILKDSGYNAIRCAHNPPSENMLKVCDRLGMLVLDESFDMWNMGKNTLDYHLYFEKWWQFDTASMVKRDRNHPCVYCWSIGNEIPEITGKSFGPQWAKVQADFVRSLDPTRPITSAIFGATDRPPEEEPPKMNWAQQRKMMLVNPPMPREIKGKDRWATQTEAAIEALDIVGYNYMWQRYKNDHEIFPKRIIHATETHSETTYDYWKAVEENNNVIGDFIWTAYDNLGEAGAGRVIWDINEPMEGLCGQYPWLSCYQGDMDLDGNRRPQSFYRKILWGLDKGIHLFTTDPEHTGVPYYGMGWHWADVKQNWTFDEQFIGQNVQLEAYADCDEVAFYVNGECKGTGKVEKLKAFLTVPYEPGKVEAAAIKDGVEVARTCLVTAGKAVKIALIPDRATIAADGMDLSFIRCELQDEKGERVQIADRNLHISVCGAGTLAGFGSGNPKTEEQYGTEQRVTFDGRALAAVRAGREAGKITVTVTAQGLPAASIVIKTK